jgi:uncharacterized protein
MQIDELTRDAILRVGAVSEVSGRIVTIKVDKNKNLSDIFIDGEILKNVAVNSFIEIRKGFLSIIGKVDGEKIEEKPISYETNGHDETDKNKRYLTVSLIGYIGQDQQFTAGTKELPLIGNEAYIVTKEKIYLIHNLVKDTSLKINIAKTDEEFDIEFPVDTLFNGHVAIFGNTGSGKSNTLASLYQELVKCLQKENKTLYCENTRFLIFDFNGEYIGENCITTHKKVYNLSTRDDKGDKIPFAEKGLLDLEVLSILSDATEKTQKPFLKRTIRFYKHVKLDENYFKNIVRKQIRQILTMSDKIRATLLVDYMRQILPETDENDDIVDIDEDIEWHNTTNQFRTKKTQIYFASDHNSIKNTMIYKRVDIFKFENNFLDNFIKFLYLQLISDILSNRAQNDHIAPMINRMNGRKNDLMRVFDTSSSDSFWRKNFIVVNLNNVNLEMRKTLPLLLSKKIYAEHKRENKKRKDKKIIERSLNLIIDEAHNILSTESFREAESWKDYRLETFEEIIKEGRKFGVFVTIASQRPSDISPTITSQAHNYFIHRLINKHDLAMVSSAVSYIDRITEESIPTLPTGTCIFSGVASQRPIKVHIDELADDLKPQSMTLQFKDIMFDKGKNNTH